MNEQEPEGARLEAEQGVQAVSHHTEQSYMKAVNAMRRRSSWARSKDIEIPAPVTVLQVAQDLLARQDLTPGARKAYRAALLWYARTQHQPDLEAIRLLEESAAAPGRPTGARSPKIISEGDFVELVGELGDMAMRSLWARRTQSWVIAGLATGARPAEWLNATWLDRERTTLRVYTSKVKLRAPAFMAETATSAARPAKVAPPYRDIPISSKYERENIAAHMDFINDYLVKQAAESGADPAAAESQDREMQFERYYNQCRQALARACERLWKDKKQYNLYTMRRQFSANQRAAVGPAATAVLMGHASPDSPAAAHYGKGNQAHARFRGLRPKQSAGHEQSHEAAGGAAEIDQCGVPASQSRSSHHQFG